MNKKTKDPLDNTCNKGTIKILVGSKNNRIKYKREIWFVRSDVNTFRFTQESNESFSKPKDNNKYNDE